ncbi:hypothetical protein ACFL6C_13435, partial [Myxococcota bacterium]
MASFMPKRHAAVLDAYYTNPSGTLEPHDELHLSIKGWGAHFPGFIDVYHGRTRAEIIKFEDDFETRFGKSIDDAVGEGVFGELSTAEQALWKLARLGVDNLTPAHLAALEAYVHGPGKLGTSRQKMFDPLEQNFDQFQQIAAIYGQVLGSTMGKDLRGERLGDKCVPARVLALENNNAPAYLAAVVRLSKPDDIVQAMVNMMGKHVTWKQLTDDDRFFDVVTNLERHKDPRVKGLVWLARNGHDMFSSPAARAVQLRAIEVERDEPLERAEALCALMRLIPPSQRPAVDAEMKAIYKESVDEYVERLLKEDTDDLAQMLEPDRRLIERAHGEWGSRDVWAEDGWSGRDALSVWTYLDQGLASPREAMVELHLLPPEKRLQLVQAYDGDQPGRFSQLVASLPEKYRIIVELDMAAASWTVDQNKGDEQGKPVNGGLDELANPVSAAHKRQRGFDHQAYLSSRMMDAFGQTGTALDHVERELSHAIQEIRDCYQHNPNHQLTSKQTERLQHAFARYVQTYAYHVDEKEVVQFWVAAAVAATLAVIPFAGKAAIASALVRAGVVEWQASLGAGAITTAASGALAGGGLCLGYQCRAGSRLRHLVSGGGH